MLRRSYRCQNRPSCIGLNENYVRYPDFYKTVFILWRAIPVLAAHWFRSCANMISLIWQISKIMVTIFEFLLCFVCRFLLRHSQKLWLGALESCEYVLDVKKNPDEKYFFIMEKFGFEKKNVTFFEKSQKFSLKKIFSPIEKFDNFWDFSEKSQIFFSKSNFSMMKKYFSSGFFLNLKSVLSAFQRT